VYYIKPAKFICSKRSLSNVHLQIAVVFTHFDASK